MRSDNLITMPEVSATEASRRFAALLDAVEHRGERFTIVRHGRVVAELGPGPQVDGAAVKAMLRRHRDDAEWAQEVGDLRRQLTVEERF
jgi:antitoxin (DNA-binding transcriptional repressor) of toxin-antitoxin stability system